MKSYGIFPAFELRNGDPRSHDCVSLIAQIVCEQLRHGGDCFHYVVDWRDPGSRPWQGCTQGLAQAHVLQLDQPERLMDLVRMSVDPYSGRSVSVIRSIATCRAVTFGWDGQAFLCLREEDDPPTSLNPALVVVEERPELLTGTDYFDGWLDSSVE